MLSKFFSYAMWVTTPNYDTEILCVTLSVEHSYIHLVQLENTITTCFGPIGGPSSGCNLDLEISYKRCVCGRCEISLFQYWVPWPKTTKTNNKKS